MEILVFLSRNFQGMNGDFDVPESKFSVVNRNLKLL